MGFVRTMCVILWILVPWLTGQGTIASDSSSSADYLEIPSDSTASTTEVPSSSTDYLQFSSERVSISTKDSSSSTDYLDRASESTEGSTSSSDYPETSSDSASTDSLSTFTDTSADVSPTNEFPSSFRDFTSFGTIDDYTNPASMGTGERLLMKRDYIVTNFDAASSETSTPMFTDTSSDTTRSTTSDTISDMTSDTTPSTISDMTSDTTRSTTSDAISDMTSDTTPNTISDMTSYTTPSTTLDAISDMTSDTTLDMTPNTSTDTSLDTSSTESFTSTSTAESTSESTWTSPEIETTISPCVEYDNTTLNMKIKADETSLDVKWDEAGPECKYHYTVSLNASSVTEIPDHSHTFPNLEPCTVYEVSIKVSYKGSVVGGDIQFSTTLTATGDSAKVRNVHISSEPFAFTIAWESPPNNCPYTYNLTCNGVTSTTSGHSFKVSELKACTQYTVTVETLSNDESIGAEESKSESTSVPTGDAAKIQELTLAPTSFTLGATWQPPPYACKYSYEISWLGYKELVSGLSYVIENLEPCMQYSVTVATLSNDASLQANESASARTSLAVPGPVKDLMIDSDKTSDVINVTWTKPEYATCVDRYRYEVLYNGAPAFGTTTPQTYVEVYDARVCVNMTFIVYAQNDPDNFGDKSEKYLNRITELAAPQFFNVTEIKVDGLTATWTIAENQPCSPDQFFMTCTDPDGMKHTEEGYQLNRLFTASLSDLLAYTDYTCCAVFQNAMGNSTSTCETIRTDAKAPETPNHLRAAGREDATLEITWQAPHRWNGDLVGYVLTIEYVRPLYFVPSGCARAGPLHFNQTHVDFTTKPLDFAVEYKISVAAESSGGWGDAVDTIGQTGQGPPQPVEDLWCDLHTDRTRNFNATVVAHWRTPCKAGGRLEDFLVELSGQRTDNPADTHVHSDTVPALNIGDYRWTYTGMRAQYKYTLTAQARTDLHTSIAVRCEFVTEAGIPAMPAATNVVNVTGNKSTAEVRITADMFDAMGTIRYYALIVAREGCEEQPKRGLFDTDNWPSVASDCSCPSDERAYQATPNHWNPFSDRNYDTSFTLGTVANCSSTNACNRQLTPNTNYSIKVRGFTSYGYSDTALVYFRTAAVPETSGVDVGLVVGLIIGILAAAFIVAGFLFYKKGRILVPKWPRMESVSQMSPVPPPVPIKKFDAHYRKMTENPGKIKSEFQLLQTISSDVALSTKTASLPDNKKKNRYVNILPYDETRVVLNVSNSASTSSDYINASYIQGFSGGREYIAAQGPTEATCPAFWQMVLEQNVRLIVMLTQFVEGGKDKCYKYFPTIVEEYDLNNDIRIECLEEQLYTVYNRRTFKVVRNNVARKIIHVQFNLWPDFDVPDDVSSMLEFNDNINEIKMKKPSLVLVHCSAGVGRTGTLIAIDILTQAIREKRKVDIFGTVLSLRKQRMTMVQSERQYEFLFKCVHYIIMRNGNTSTDRISESHM